MLTTRGEHRARVRARRALREAAAAPKPRGGAPAVKPGPAAAGPAADFDQAKHPRGRGGKWSAGGGAAPGPAPAQAAAGVLPLPPRTTPPKLYAAAFQRNRDFAEPGPYHTELSPREETQFRKWLEENGVPYNPQMQITDYDMRGHWKASGGAVPKPGKKFPPEHKTPYDPMFSKKSRYATDDCPFDWKGDHLVDERNGQVIFR